MSIGQPLNRLSPFEVTYDRGDYIQRSIKVDETGVTVSSITFLDGSVLTSATGLSSSYDDLDCGTF
jgi:hypothetical protein